MYVCPARACCLFVRSFVEVYHYVGDRLHCCNSPSFFSLSLSLSLSKCGFFCCLAHPGAGYIYSEQSLKPRVFCASTADRIENFHAVSRSLQMNECPCGARGECVSVLQDVRARAGRCYPQPPLNHIIPRSNVSLMTPCTVHCFRRCLRLWCLSSSVTMKSTGRLRTRWMLLLHKKRGWTES